MDLYLPDEFYALSESPNARRSAREDAQWLGGEAYVAPIQIAARSEQAEPDPIWRVI